MRTTTTSIRYRHGGHNQRMNRTRHWFVVQCGSLVDADSVIPFDDEVRGLARDISVEFLGIGAWNDPGLELPSSEPLVGRTTVTSGASSATATAETNCNGACVCW